MDLSKIGQVSFGRSILVIPDAHARPGEDHSDFDRFYAAGRLALDLKPDMVVILGDLGDFDSLNPHKPKLEGTSFDGRELEKDRQAFRSALRAILAPIRAANKRHEASRRRDRIYLPPVPILEGNHEERYRRKKELSDRWRDLEEIAEEEGCIWHSFLAPVDICGILFSHYFTTGVSKRAAGIRQILNATHRSCVYGHTHSFGLDVKPVLGGGTITALCAGCYKPPHRTGEHEWSGLMMLTDVQDGSFSVQQFPYDHVLERYGEGGYARELRTARANSAKDREATDIAFA